MAESRGPLEDHQQFCTACGQIINKSDVFCGSCGSDVQGGHPIQQASRKPNPVFRVIWIVVSLLIPVFGLVLGAIYLFARGRRRYAGMLLGLGILSIIMWSAIADSGSESTPVAPKLTHSQIKAKAENIPYDSLFRYNERYIGKIIMFKGEVVQAIGSSKIYALRVNMNDDYDQTVYVEYSGPRILEGDSIQIWGEVLGLETYTSIFGGSVTLPRVEELITVVK